jgi:hypothetical protein
MGEGPVTRKLERNVTAILPEAVRVGWAPDEERVVLQFMVRGSVVTFSLPDDGAKELADGIYQAIRDGDTMRTVQ